MGIAGRLCAVAVCFGLVGPLVLATASPVEAKLSDVEFDLLKARLAGALKQGDFESALEMIGEIKRSGRPTSPTLIYFEGFSLQNLGRLAEAEAAYRGYLDTAGSSGAYYQKALERIVETEGRIAEAMASYKALLDRAPYDDVRQQLDALEVALGARVAPLRAEWERADAERRREAEEQVARAAAEKQRLSELAWEKTVTMLDATEQRFSGIAVSSDGSTIAVVGQAKDKACNGLDDGWILMLDAEGELRSNGTTCQHRDGFPFDTVFHDVTPDPNSGFLVVGTSHRGEKHSGSLFHITPESVLDSWNVYLRDPNSSEYSVLNGVTTTRSGHIVIAGTVMGLGFGSDRTDGDILFHDTNSRLWTARSRWEGDASYDSQFFSAAELTDGGLVAVGLLEESDIFGYYNLSGVVRIVDSSGNHRSGFNLRESDSQLRSVAPDKNGRAMAVGNLIMEDERAAGLIIQIGAQGEDLVIWRKYYPDEAVRFTDILQVDDGFVVIGEAEAAGAGRQGWIGKIDAQGQLLWSETHGGPGDDSFVSVAHLPGSDSFVVAGRKDGSQGWVLRLNAQGELKENLL